MAKEELKESEKVFEEIMSHIRKGENFLLSGGAGSGKTYTLVQVIKQVLEENPITSIACITYTNAAVKEIKERINHKNLIVLTIHDFLWSIISNFQKELKKVLIELINDPQQTLFNIDDEEIIPNGYFNSIEGGVKYKEYLRLKEAIISHDELLVLENQMFKKYPKLCDILKDRYKFIFVDEYQDTSQFVIEIFLEHITISKKHNIIGFFGDSMQSIYDHGVGNINKYKGEGGIIKEVIKEQNRRNPQNVIKLANRLRNDGIEQKPSDNENAPNMNSDGSVKNGTIKFIYSYSENEYLDKLRKYLRWDFKDSKEVKELNLTHNLIARKAEFKTLMKIYDKDAIIAYLGFLRKYIRTTKYEYSDITLDKLKRDIQKKVNNNIDALRLSHFTILKYLGSIKNKYPDHCETIDNLIENIKPIESDTINNEQKILLTEFKRDTGIDEIDFVYQIKLMKDIKKGISEDFIPLYNTIKDKPYVKVKNLYIKSDQLIDDKKQEEEDENRKGSKRDDLVKHLFKIQNNIACYERKKYNNFLKITGYKLNKISEKQILKEKIESLSKNVGNKTIEEVIKEAHGETNKSICVIDDKLERFIREKEYIYNRVKDVKYEEFQKLYEYLEGQTPFSTQHKTKGAEFNNVLVILDNGNWGDYNFKYLFKEEGTQTVLERTQKIFYVCCTRAKENLAVFFHKPESYVLEKAKIWFEGNVVNLDEIKV